MIKIHNIYNAEKVYEKIKKEKAVLKIILKTKDEPFFLEEWIKYHINIVGSKNIIIIDNISTINKIYDIYDTYKNDVHILQYEGFMDRLHLMDIFKDLYISIKYSSNFVIFIDTDEFLCMHHNKNIYSDYTLLKFLNKNHSKTSFPTHWVSSYIHKYNKFIFPANKYIISNNLKHGKIILNTDLIFNPCTNLFHTKLTSVDALKNTMCNFLLLHRKTSNIKQRIQSNVNKLKSLGAIKNSNIIYAIKEIKNINLDSVYDFRIKKFILEINSYINQDINKHIFNDYILLNHNNTISFSNQKVEDYFLTQIAISN